MTKHKAQAGHTLVELMLALALSLYLMSGLLQSLVANKQAFFFVAEQARINNSGLYALRVLQQHIERAGYRNQVLAVASRSGREAAFPENDLFDAAAVISGENNVRSDSNVKAGSDVLHLRYQSAVDGGFKDCRGARLAEEHGTVTMSFFIDRDNQLRCRGRVNSGGGRPSAVLLEDVSHFQVLYKLALSTDTGSNLVYLNAEQVAALGADAWRSVVALKIALVTEHQSAGTDSLDGLEVRLLDEVIHLPLARQQWQSFEHLFGLENIPERLDG